MSKACELSRMETDSSQKTKSSQTHVYAFIEGRIARYDGPRLHCAPDVTAPHSFNMLLQQCAKEQKLSAISRKHSTTAGGTLCTQKLAQRRSEGPRNDPKWPLHLFCGPSPLPFGGSTVLETYSSTTSRSRPRTRGESIRG